MGALESEIQAQIMLAGGGRDDTRLFRNNVGLGWSGRVIGKPMEGRIMLQDARPVKYGLCPGSADLIGVRRLTILPEHVGRVVGVLVSAEVKNANGRVRPEQQTWARVMLAFGALHGTVRSRDDINALLESI